MTTSIKKTGILKFKQEKFIYYKEDKITQLDSETPSTFQNKIFNEKISDNEFSLNTNDNIKEYSNFDNSFENLSNFLKESLISKEKADSYFKEKKYDFAINEYYKSIDKLNCEKENKIDSDYKSSPSYKKFNLIKIECIFNISVCYLLLKKYENVIMITNKIINSDFTVYKFKAYIIRSKAYSRIGKYTKEINCLKMAYEIGPSFQLLKKIDFAGQNLQNIQNLKKFSKSGSLDNILQSSRSSNIFSRIFKIARNDFWSFINNNKLICFLIFSYLFYEIRKGITKTLKNIRIEF